MKVKNVLGAISLMVIVSSSAFALSPKESSSEQYLINHGYSAEAARIVNLQKRQIKGDPPEVDLKDKSVNFLKKIHAYIDPFVDDGEFGDRKIKHDPYDLGSPYSDQLEEKAKQMKQKIKEEKQLAKLEKQKAKELEKQEEQVEKKSKKGFFGLFGKKEQL